MGSSKPRSGNKGNSPASAPPGWLTPPAMPQMKQLNTVSGRDSGNFFSLGVRLRFHPVLPLLVSQQFSSSISM